MNRYALRGVIALVLVLTAVFVRYRTRSALSDQSLQQAHKLIAQVPGYTDKPEYYDWLVDEAHQTVFANAYYTQRRGRYGESSRVDKGRYYSDLFECMIEKATADHAAGVTDALTKYRSEHPEYAQ